jgi:hypothetical protein
MRLHGMTQNHSKTCMRHLELLLLITIHASSTQTLCWQPSECCPPTTHHAPWQRRKAQEIATLHAQLNLYTAGSTGHLPPTSRVVGLLLPSSGLLLRPSSRRSQVEGAPAQTRCLTHQSQRTAGEHRARSIYVPRELH